LNRPRILFVDDESAILDAMQNLLRKERKRWDLEFVNGGEAGLAAMQKQPFDIVVSDMRMPGMDGAEFLTRIKAEWPAAGRMVLSGHAEPEALMRAMPVAHQFLSKPCDARTLQAAIERMHGLQKLLNNDAIRKVVGNLEQLPAMPRTYIDLRQAASDPNKGIGDLADIVSSDAAVSVKVLKLVNSSYFGSSQRVTSIQQAVSRLGVELIKGLALTANVFAAVEAKAVAGFSCDQLQMSSLSAAKLAKRFCSDPKRSDEAFTAALVSDVGKLVLALALPQSFGELLVAAKTSGKPAFAVEHELLGVTHAEIGAYLLGLWGLPASIVESVAHHHHPNRVTDGNCVLAAVHVANGVVDLAPGLALSAQLDLEFLERCGYMAELPKWLALAEAELCRSREAMADSHSG
jgi:HD-like signal output (HDOD) protein/CheY-like chemotaxis protein